jgi:hypothetical protein
MPVSLADIVRDMNTDAMCSVKVLVAMNTRHTTYTAQMLPVRLVIVRKSDEDTAYTRKMVRDKARRNQRSVASEDSLLMAGYCVFATSLPHDTYDDARIAQLYRLRWQIELAFKRLKSLMQIDEFRARDAAIIQCCLYASLLLALLTEDIAEESVQREAYQAQKTGRQVSCWRLHSIILLHVKSAVMGISGCLHNMMDNMAAMWRNLCEPPRTRKLQGVIR